MICGQQSAGFVCVEVRMNNQQTTGRALGKGSGSPSHEEILIVHFASQAQNWIMLYVQPHWLNLLLALTGARLPTPSQLINTLQKPSVALTHRFRPLEQTSMVQAWTCHVSNFRLAFCRTTYPMRTQILRTLSDGQDVKATKNIRALENTYQLRLTLVFGVENYKDKSGTGAVNAFKIYYT